MKDLYRALKVSNLTVHYASLLALWDISLEVPKQKLVCIIGPNGAGKSTFMKALLGIVPTVSGSSEFFDQSIGKVRQKIAYVPQRISIDWQFPITAIEVVLMGGYHRYGLFKNPKKSDVEEAKLLMQKFGILDLASRQISELSGGQQQRLFLARALMQRAEIYFFDEPFAGVDLLTEKMMMEAFKELKNQGKTIFVVHHDLNTVQEYFDWVILLKQRLVANGPTNQVFNAEHLSVAYGGRSAYLDEILERSVKQQQGLI
jgi:manganese/zinc/iron transport system ATP- binding protein